MRRWLVGLAARRAGGDELGNVVGVNSTIW
jgi:hypothetical protein